MQPLDDLLKRMSNTKDMDSRNALFEEIIALGESIIPELLIRIRKDEASFILTGVLTKFGEDGKSALLELFFDESLKENHSQDMRLRAVASALWQVSSEGLMERLLPVIIEDHPNLRYYAKNILWRKGDSRLREPMVKLLEDKNSSQDQCKIALELLKHFGTEAEISLVRRFLTDEQLAYTALLTAYTIGDDVFEPMKAILLDVNAPEKRAFIVDALYEKKDDRFVPFLIEAVEYLNANQYDLGRDGWQREFLSRVFWFFAEIKDDRTVDILLKSIDADELEPIKAMETLAKIGSDKALEALISRVGRNFVWWDEWGMGKEALQKALGAFGNRSIEALLAILENPENNHILRIIAAEYLIHFKAMPVASKRMFAALMPMFEDRSLSLYERMHAAKKLCQIEEPQVADIFLNYLDNPEYEPILYHREFVDYLHGLRDKRFFAPVLRKFQAGEILPAGSTQFQIDTMSETIYGFNVYTNTDALLAMLNDQNRYLQRPAIREVGRRQLQEAIEPLEALMPNVDYNLRGSIKSSLYQIRNKNS